MCKVKFIALTMAILMLLMGAVAFALTTPVYVDDDWAGKADGWITPEGYTIGLNAFATIGGGVGGVSIGGTVNVLAGTYVLASTVVVNKAMTIDGVGVTTVVQVATAVGYAFDISASGVTLRDIKLQKTGATGPHYLIYVNANNASILYNTIYGPAPTLPWSYTSCAMNVAGGLTGLLINNNTIYDLRFPAEIAATTVGTVSNNAVTKSDGWQNAGNITFTGNSWSATQVADIKLYLACQAFYPDLIALSNANNNAYIDANLFVPADQGRPVSNIVSPATIASGIAGTLAGGTVNVAAGTYPEYNLLVNKPMTILGTGYVGTTTIDATGFPASVQAVVDINITSGNVLFDGFKILTGEHRGINVNAPSPSIVTITHNKLVGVGVNTAPTIAVPDGENFGVYLVPGMTGKLVFDYNDVSEFYNNSLLIERVTGQTQVMHNTFSHTWQMFYMTHSAIDITALQKVSFNTFDVSGVTVVPGTHDLNSAVKFNTSVWWIAPQTGKFTNVEISDNIINGLSSNTRGIVLQNDDAVAGVPGEILAPKILHNTINGTSVTNTIGMEFKGYIHNAVVTDNVISGVDVGIKLWIGNHSIYCPDQTALTGNTISNNQTGLLNIKDVVGNGALSATSNIFCCGNTTNASDDKAGNTYNQNYWYDWDRAAFPAGYAIGGGGGNVDANPNVDYGLDMTPNSIAYSAIGSFDLKVNIERCVLGLNAADIWLECPGILSAVVTSLDPNFSIFSTQTTNPANTRDTVKVQLGVMTGTTSGPDELFKVVFTGSTSCIPLGSDIRMIYRDLRDNLNAAILAPLASPTTFTSNPPTIVFDALVTPAGGYYNHAPSVNLSAAYGCNLLKVWYQVDGGAWLTVAAGLTAPTWSQVWTMPTIDFTNPLLLDNTLHSILFWVDAADGRYGTTTWTFWKDVTVPFAPTGLTAAPGHNKVHLAWANPTVGPLTFDHAVVRRTMWFLGGNGYPLYSLIALPEGPYPTWSTGVQVYSGTGSAYDNTSIALRDVYHYAVFAVDQAGNVSAPSTGAKSTSYWLGDIKPTVYDGYVKVEDLGSFASTYGLSTGQTGYFAEADIAPATGGAKGLPVPDGTVYFGDLSIFAINYGAVLPTGKPRPTLPGFAIKSETGLRLAERMTTTTFDVDLYLDNRNDLAKSLLGEISYDPTMLEYVSTVQGQDLAASQLPVFFKALTSPKQISVSAAVLGNGVSIDGSGLIATISFRVLGPGKTTVQLSKVDIRDKDDRSLVSENIQLPGAEAVASVDVPATYEIAQNQPNPFNPETVIKYGLPSATQVSVRIYNIVGQLVKTLVDDYQPAGQHQVVWNGTNENGERVASGIYLYRFVTPDYQKTLKMTLLK